MIGGIILNQEELYPCVRSQVNSSLALDLCSLGMDKLRIMKRQKLNGPLTFVM